MIGAQDCNWRVGTPRGSCAYVSQSDCWAVPSTQSAWMGVTGSCSTFPASTTFSFYQNIGVSSDSRNRSFYIAYADSDSVEVRLNNIAVFTGTNTVSSAATRAVMLFQLVTLPALSRVSSNVLEIRVINGAGAAAGFNLYFVTNLTSTAVRNSSVFSMNYAVRAGYATVPQGTYFGIGASATFDTHQSKYLNT